ncbi:MAG: hypothetical protein ACFCUT_11040 [Kiloniellaceae bacterium]
MSEALSDDLRLLKQMLLPSLPEGPITPGERTVFRRAIIVYGYIYEDDQNPLWCWRAFATARALGDPTPEWVLAYFDSAASAVWRLADGAASGTDSSARGIASAIGFSPNRGRGTILSKAANPKWLHDGYFVARCVRAGEKEYLAIEQVAERCGRSESQVRLGWKRWQRVFPDDVS